MKKLVVALVWVTLVVLAAGPSYGALVLSLDGTRTGDESETGGDRYLTSDAMANATGVLTSAGFTVATTNLFTAANITGARVLYTGAVDVAFSATELTDIQSFVHAGGGLVIQRDWGDFYPAADPLLSLFGVTIDVSPVGPRNAANPVVDVTGGTHPIWNGPAGSVSTYDQVYSSSIASGPVGMSIIGRHNSAAGSGALGVLTSGLGRVVILTDMDAWDDLSDPVSPTPGSNNAIVWENIFHWAAAGGTGVVPEPSALAVWGLLGLCGTFFCWRNKRR